MDDYYISVQDGEVKKGWYTENNMKDCFLIEEKSFFNEQRDTDKNIASDSQQSWHFGTPVVE